MFGRRFVLKECVLAKTWTSPHTDVTYTVSNYILHIPLSTTGYTLVAVWFKAGNE